MSLETFVTQEIFSCFLYLYFFLYYAYIWFGFEMYMLQNTYIVCYFYMLINLHREVLLQNIILHHVSFVIFYLYLICYKAFIAQCFDTATNQFLQKGHGFPHLICIIWILNVLYKSNSLSVMFSHLSMPLFVLLFFACFFIIH